MKRRKGDYSATGKRRVISAPTKIRGKEKNGGEWGSSSGLRRKKKKMDDSPSVVPKQLKVMKRLDALASEPQNENHRKQTKEKGFFGSMEAS